MEDLSGMQCNDTRFGARPKSAGEINGGCVGVQPDVSCICIDG